MTKIILSKIAVFGEIFKFYYLKNDKYVGQRVALGKYEEYETELMLRQAHHGDVVIDIGANIGYYTLLLAQKAQKVYAFEPDKTNFEILEKNIKANNLNNIVAINAAVSDKNGTNFLYKSEENFGDHRLKPPFDQNPSVLQSRTSPLKKGRGQKEKVKTIKLDDYFKNQKIDLIKIDTQGWEPKVIEGTRRLIEKYKPIIFFEYWPEGMKEAKLEPNGMIKFLEKIYKKIFLIDDELNIYSQKNKKQIDKYCRKQKSGYVDLWVKKDIGFDDRIGQIKDIKIKKLIKKILSL